jgi:hypothetical protein
MIEASPVLRDRIAAPRSRNAYNSAFVKGFDGGQLLITGANSAAALRSTPCRYLFMDEIDGYPSDVDQEGDPVALAIARTQTFKGRRKIFMASTPTVAGISRIEKASAKATNASFTSPASIAATSRRSNGKTSAGRKGIGKAHSWFARFVAVSMPSMTNPGSWRPGHGKQPRSATGGPRAST